MADDPASLGLTLSPGGTAAPSRFFAAGASLVDLLDALCEDVGVEWKFSNLAIGSAKAGIIPERAFSAIGSSAIERTARGLHLIRSGESAPADWDPHSIALARDFASSVTEGDKAYLKYSNNVIPIDRKLRERLQEISPWKREFQGSVRGQLTGLNVTRGNRASLKPVGGGRMVRIAFPDALKSALMERFETFIEVSGTVFQDEDGVNYRVAASEISALDGGAESWVSIIGAVPNLTHGLSVEEFLREVRGE